MEKSPSHALFVVVQMTPKHSRIRANMKETWQKNEVRETTMPLKMIKSKQFFNDDGGRNEIE